MLITLSFRWHHCKPECSEASIHLFLLHSPRQRPSCMNRKWFVLFPSYQRQEVPSPCITPKTQIVLQAMERDTPGKNGGCLSFMDFAIMMQLADYTHLMKTKSYVGVREGAGLPQEVIQSCDCMGSLATTCSWLYIYMYVVCGVFLPPGSLDPREAQQS